ncbi:IclR family transcriptional regulator C-terminal domain-containing protein [Spongiactinospora sp. 9N601]|uniref:IclR family transcriptional regulator domain-containing protein n=1 Tax=Spongiactinospora sp. 9N601 TaxID=3375149 RepID=UPI00378B6544
MGEDADFLTSLARGLAVLEAFDADHPAMSLADVARVTSLDRSAVRRLLHTLVERGYVRTDGQSFALHPSVLRIGTAYLSSLALPEVAVPHLRRIADQVQESASVAVLEGDEIVYVAHVPTRRLMSMSLTVGSRLPAYATSMGRVLLAHKDDEWLDAYFGAAVLTPLTRRTETDPARLRAEFAAIRKRGWAVADEELEAGLRSIAAPIEDAAGEVVAAVNVSSHAGRLSVQELVAVAREPLCAAARAISVETADAGRGARSVSR